mgnify:CR=1 FL=1
MNVTKELLDIGFTEYEAKVYAVLVSGDLMSANDISKVAGVPRGRVYDVLGSLMNEGLCKMVPGSVKQYQALDPGKVFDGILKRNFDAYIHREKQIKDLSRKLEQEHSEHKGLRNELDCVSIYTSKLSIAKKSDEMVHETQSILRSLCKPKYLTPRKLDDLNEVTAPVVNAIASGREFRSIYEIEEDNMENLLYICKHFHDHGEKVRFMKKLPLKLVIMDSSAAMFTMFHRSMTKNNITAMYVEHSDIVIAMIDLFEHYWNLATPFEDFQP